MKILITGGCKNGKSFYAQQIISILGKHKQNYYIATMQPCDSEDLERIKRHKEERFGYDFITIEQPKNINECVFICNEKTSVLLDSTTALLQNEMFLKDGSVTQPHEKISKDILDLSKRVQNIVVVSDYIYSDAYIYDDLTENYRFSLAYIDRHLASDFDVVCEVFFGNVTFHKGGIII